MNIVVNKHNNQTNYTHLSTVQPLMEAIIKHDAAKALSLMKDTNILQPQPPYPAPLLVISLYFPQLLHSIHPHIPPQTLIKCRDEVNNTFLHYVVLHPPHLAIPIIERFERELNVRSLKNVLGNTLLHEACYVKNEGVVEYLINHNWNVKEKNAMGITAEDIIARYW